MLFIENLDRDPLNESGLKVTLFRYSRIWPCSRAGDLCHPLLLLAANHQLFAPLTLPLAVFLPSHNIEAPLNRVRKNMNSQ